MNAGNGAAWLVNNKTPTTTPRFSDVWQTKGFKSNEFGSVANKGVTGLFCGCVARKGLRGRKGGLRKGRRLRGKGREKDRSGVRPFANGARCKSFEAQGKRSRLILFAGSRKTSCTKVQKSKPVLVTGKAESWSRCGREKKNHPPNACSARSLVRFARYQALARDKPQNKFVKSHGIRAGGTTGERRSVTSQAPPVLPQRKPYLTGSPPSRRERRCRQECRVNPSIARDRGDFRASVSLTFGFGHAKASYR